MPKADKRKDRLERERGPAQPCRDCGDKEGARFGPDPYLAEIDGDMTPVWLCDSCRMKRIEEI